MRYDVTPAFNGYRLDNYLKEQLNQPLFTRSYIVKLIDGVSINGKPAKKGNILKTGDIIEFEDRILQKEVEKDDDIKSTQGELNIVEETERYIVINKPKGIAVHPSKDNVDNTVANYIKYYLENKQEYDSRIKRAGITHRLDKKVSGLMIVAKTLEYQQYLQSLFEKRLVKKVYLAKIKSLNRLVIISENNLEDELNILINNNFVVDNRWIKVEKYITRDPKNRLRMKLNDKKIGRNTITYILPLKNNQILVMIETGRKHQIRATVNDLGWVVVGDGLYGDTNNQEGIELEQILLKLDIDNNNERMWKLV